MPEHTFHTLARTGLNDLRIGDFIAFLLVCDNRNITHAAAKMHITPQGLGKQIRAMEKTLGVPLFVRSAKQLSLSYAGQQLKLYAESIVDLADRVHSMTLRVQREQTGYLRLAYSRILNGTEAVAHLEAFKSAYPGIELDLITASDVDTHQLVADEGYLALTVAPHHPGALSLTRLRSFPYRLLMPKGHPLAKKTSLTARDLAGMPLILLDEGHMAHHNIVQMCRQLGFEPEVRYVASGSGSAANLVKRGQGCAVLMWHATEPLDLSEIASCELHTETGWQAVFMARQDHAFTQPEKLFFDFLVEKFRAH